MGGVGAALLDGFEELFVEGSWSLESDGGGFGFFESDWE